MEYAHIQYTFPGHRQRILHLELSPDRTQFLSCSEDATVKLWKLEGLVCKNKAEEEFDEHGELLHVKLAYDNLKHF
jgi:WD40 repeat protein